MRDFGFAHRRGARTQATGGKTEVGKAGLQHQSPCVAASQERHGGPPSAPVLTPASPQPPHRCDSLPSATWAPGVHPSRKRSPSAPSLRARHLPVSCRRQRPRLGTPRPPSEGRPRELAWSRGLGSRGGRGPPRSCNSTPGPGDPGRSPAACLSAEPSLAPAGLRLEVPGSA